MIQFGTHIPDLSDTDADVLCMQRALQLARNGLGETRSNPMVGAVIVAADGTVIGQGYHRRVGGPHAEVWAVRSVSDTNRPLLRHATMYVTLEPCAHYGKTPPCANLIVDTGIPRVVVGAVDPFAKVAGRGIAILRDAGCEVRTGLLADLSQQLNAPFFTAHTLHRPFVTLKWAMSADGYMDVLRGDGDGAMRFSTATGTTLVHRLRAGHQAIVVGSGTAIADNPRLDVRCWSGDNPRRVVVDRRGRLGAPTPDFDTLLSQLYADGVTSVLVEGGATLLAAIIAAGLWDVARVEVSPVTLGHRGTAHIDSPAASPVAVRRLDGNTIYYYSNNALVTPYFVENGL